MRQARLRHKEVFVPLAHPPGDAQGDFGEALVAIGGEEQKGHFLCVDLPHSDDSFVMMFPAENTEAFLEGHNQAFACFQGVPRTILYDNTRIAVKEITGDGERKSTEAFSGLQSHYLFAAKFGRPGKGNDKGNVEGLVGYARRNFMVPVPRAASWEELNAQLLGQCRRRREQKVWGQPETIAERFERDREKLLALLEQKSNALDQAAPLQGWQLPEEFTELRRQMEARLGKRGRREYVQVRLMETFPLTEVAAAVRQALQLRAIAFDAKLDLENYPHLPICGSGADTGGRLSGAADGRGPVMDSPQVLLEHYLKQLRLPTMVREYPKLAEQCAKEGATFEVFLLRLVEQEMVDRERRATERRIKAAKFPVSKSLETTIFSPSPH